MSSIAQLPTDRIVTFRWHTRTHSIERTGEVVLYREDVLDEGSAVWVWDALLTNARSSHKSPLARSSLMLLLDALKKISQLPSWALLCSMEPSLISMEAVLKVFTDFDTLLLKTCNPNNAYRLSVVFRNFFGDAVVRVSADTRLRQLRKTFKTKCSFNRNGRPLISDVVHHSRPILAALPHENLKDLYKKTAEILENDLERIRRCALDIVKNYYVSIAELDRIEAINFSFFDVVAMERLFLSGSQEGYSWDIKRIEIYISIRLSIVQGKTPRVAVFEKERVPSPIIEHAKFLSRLENVEKNFVGWLKSREFPSKEVLLSCALIIQIKTGWNFSSVLDLSSESVDVRNMPHRLQSVKTKVGDETPLVLIEKSDDDVLSVLSLLSARSASMKRVGVRNSGIWTGTRISPDGVYKKISSWRLKDFCLKYDLPEFSPDMLRGQVIAVDSVNKGNLPLAQSRAGHTSLNTTLHYLNKNVIRNLNSANTFEFEKRFDATIRYLSNSDALAEDEKILSYPIGDGSSCARPESPPTDDWLSSGLCTAKHCHEGEGCVNRRIEINKSRIEEVVLTKNYYQSNWVRLFNDNPHSFEKNHLSSMMFAFALYGAISRGPYRHLIRVAEK